MAFALLIIGTVLLVASIRNAQNCLVNLVQADFVGANNFGYWVVALIVVGAIGYVDKLKKLSDGLLVLIFVALFLSKGTGFFSKFTSALQTTTTFNPSTGKNILGGTVGIGGINITLPGTNPTPTRPPGSIGGPVGPIPGPLGGGGIIIPGGGGGFYTPPSQGVVEL